MSDQQQSTPQHVAQQLGARCALRRAPRERQRHGDADAEQEGRGDHVDERATFPLGMHQEAVVELP